MIYLSKLRERYLAALRLHIQRGILRGRNTEKLLLQLKKIMLCEAMSSEGENSPLDILKYADSLLGCNHYTAAKGQTVISRAVGRRSFSYKPKGINRTFTAFGG